MSNQRFQDYLLQTLQRKNTTQSGLARKMGTAPSTISSWVRGIRIPDVESCFRIADALDLLPSEVMVAAGHPVDVGIESSPLEDRLVAVWRRLSPDGQEAAMEFVEFMRTRERRQS